MRPGFCTEFYFPAQPGWSQYPDYYENTHIEALEAKKMKELCNDTIAD